MGEVGNYTIKFPVNKETLNPVKSPDLQKVELAKESWIFTIQLLFTEFLDLGYYPMLFVCLSV